jgi:hypothetical protein
VLKLALRSWERREYNVRVTHCFLLRCHVPQYESMNMTRERMLYEYNNIVAENCFRKHLSSVGGGGGGGGLVGEGTSSLFNVGATNSEHYHTSRQSGSQCSSR